MGKNTSRAPAPQPHTLYIWPRPGDDLPRLDWSSWLRLIGLQIAADYHGPEGQFLSAHIIALAEHARVLGATSPDSHERLAQVEADREAAWVAALENEAMSPGVWSLTDPGGDEIGGWGGHPQDICEDTAQRGYFSTDPDETWCN